MKRINPVIIAGWIQGRCPKCGEAFKGHFSTMDQTQDVTLVCDSCHHKGNYFYRWPDELPAMPLRHRSSQKLLSDGKKRRKKNVIAKV